MTRTTAENRLPGDPDREETVARMIRVDQAGEFGAVRIYAGQRAFLRRGAAADAGIDPIFLLSPTTTDARIRRAASLGSGFLYGISRLGVTGAREAIAAGASELAGRIRSVTDLPIALGFGISSPEHVSAVGRWADAAVVGSALVDVIARTANGDLSGEVERYVRWLRGAAPARTGE